MLFLTFKLFVKMVNKKLQFKFSTAEGDRIDWQHYSLKSDDVLSIKNHNNSLRLLLFIKKSNSEGNDFYYMGDVKPINETFEEATIQDDHGKSVSVVKVIFKLNQPVEDSLFDYLTK